MKVYVLCLLVLAISSTAVQNEKSSAISNQVLIKIIDVVEQAYKIGSDNLISNANYIQK